MSLENLNEYLAVHQAPDRRLEIFIDTDESEFSQVHFLRIIIGKFSRPRFFDIKTMVLLELRNALRKEKELDDKTAGEYLSLLQSIESVNVAGVFAILEYETLNYPLWKLVKERYSKAEIDKSRYDFMRRFHNSDLIFYVHLLITRLQECFFDIKALVDGLNDGTVESAYLVDALAQAYQRLCEFYGAAVLSEFMASSRVLTDPLSLQTATVIDGLYQFSQGLLAEIDLLRELRNRTGEMDVYYRLKNISIKGVVEQQAEHRRLFRYCTEANAPAMARLAEEQQEVVTQQTLLLDREINGYINSLDIYLKRFAVFDHRWLPAVNLSNPELVVCQVVQLSQATTVISLKHFIGVALRNSIRQRLEGIKLQDTQVQFNYVKALRDFAGDNTKTISDIIGTMNSYNDILTENEQHMMRRLLSDEALLALYNEHQAIIDNAPSEAITVSRSLNPPPLGDSDDYRVQHLLSLMIDGQAVNQIKETQSYRHFNEKDVVNRLLDEYAFIHQQRLRSLDMKKKAAYFQQIDNDPGAQLYFHLMSYFRENGLQSLDQAEAWWYSRKPRSDQWCALNREKIVLQAEIKHIEKYLDSYSLALRERALQLFKNLYEKNQPGVTDETERFWLVSGVEETKVLCQAVKLREREIEAAARAREAARLAEEQRLSQLRRIASEKLVGLERHLGIWQTIDDFFTEEGSSKNLSFQVPHGDAISYFDAKTVFLWRLRQALRFYCSEGFFLKEGLDCNLGDYLSFLQHVERMGAMGIFRMFDPPSLGSNGYGLLPGGSAGHDKINENILSIYNEIEDHCRRHASGGTASICGQISVLNAYIENQQAFIVLLQQLCDAWIVGERGIDIFQKLLDKHRDDFPHRDMQEVEEFFGNCNQRLLKIQNLTRMLKCKLREVKFLKELRCNARLMPVLCEAVVKGGEPYKKWESEAAGKRCSGRLFDKGCIGRRLREQYSQLQKECEANPAAQDSLSLYLDRYRKFDSRFDRSVNLSRSQVTLCQSVKLQDEQPVTVTSIRDVLLVAVRNAARDYQQNPQCKGYVLESYWEFLRKLENTKALQAFRKLALNFCGLPCAEMQIIHGLLNDAALLSFYEKEKNAVEADSSPAIIAYVAHVPLSFNMHDVILPLVNNVFDGTPFNNENIRIYMDKEGSHQGLADVIRDDQWHYLGVEYSALYEEYRELNMLNARFHFICSLDARRFHSVVEEIKTLEREISDKEKMLTERERVLGQKLLVLEIRGRQQVDAPKRELDMLRALIKGNQETRELCQRVARDSLTAKTLAEGSRHMLIPPPPKIATLDAENYTFDMWLDCDL